MNYLQRAWRYITRRPTKSILLMITFFVIGNFVILGLGISQAAENAKILTRKSMKAVVDYEVDSTKYYDYVNGLTDQDAINQAYKNYPTIDDAVAQELAKDSRVKAYNYLVSNIMYSKDFDNVPVGNEETNPTTQSYTDETGAVHTYTNPNITVKANLYPNMSPSTISQYAGLEAIAKGDADIETHRESFKARRNYVVAQLNKMGLHTPMPEGAFYVFPNISSTGLKSFEFCTRLLKEAKVAIIPGNAFGPSGEGFARISYAYSLDELKTSLDRIREFLKQFQ